MSFEHARSLPVHRLRRLSDSCYQIHPTSDHRQQCSRWKKSRTDAGLDLPPLFAITFVSESNLAQMGTAHVFGDLK